MRDPHRRIAVASAFDVWVLPGAALFLTVGAHRHLPGALAAALAGALAHPMEALAVAQSACRTAACSLSDALYTLDLWQDAGLVADVPLASGVPGVSESTLLEMWTDSAGSCAVVLARRLPEVTPARVGEPFVVVQPWGTDVSVGPYVPTGDAEAFRTVQARIERTHPAHELARRLGGELVRPAPLANSPAAWAGAAALLARPERLRGMVRHVGQGGTPGRAHRLWETAPPSASPSGQVVGVPDGGYRTVPPESTLKRLRTLSTPVAGPVVSMHRAATATRGFTMHLGLHSLTHRPRDIDHLERSRQWSAGKGATDAQARASALCEALERHCGVWRGDEATQRARFADLGDAALPPDALQGFSAAQFAARERSNAADSRLCARVPAPFDDHDSVPWSRARSLTSGRDRLVPTAWAYYGTHDDAGARYVVADSNGCAAGNTWEEAVLQGLLELIERDAVALWWYPRVRRPGVCIDGHPHPAVRTLVDVAGALDRSVWALDLTHDLGVPVFAALSRREAERVGGPEHLVFGFGAHVDPYVALGRACSELCQAFPIGALRPRRRGALPGLPDWGRASEDWLTTATTEDEPYLLPSAAPATVVPVHPAMLPERIHDVLDPVVTRVANAVGDVLVLDQSRRDVPLSVVRVIAPGLRHFWRRLAPGRLYTVPVALGTAPPEFTEIHVNRWTMFA